MPMSYPTTKTLNKFVCACICVRSCAWTWALAWAWVWAWACKCRRKENIFDRRWVEITPLSEKPPPRAYHAVWMTGGVNVYCRTNLCSLSVCIRVTYMQSSSMWVRDCTCHEMIRVCALRIDLEANKDSRKHIYVGADGFKMVVHGGQSTFGEGANPAVSDTWRLDLSTYVWTSFISDPVAPSLSHAFCEETTNSTVVLFGGRTNSNTASGFTMIMHASNGWRPILPAGDGPAKRTGHVATFDSSTGMMLVSHGMNWRRQVLDDTWILDVNRGEWMCTAGDAPGCSAGLHKPRPPPMAFSAFTSTNELLFTFGGSTLDSPSGVSDLWALRGMRDWQLIQVNLVESLHSFPTGREAVHVWSVFTCAYMCVCLRAYTHTHTHACTNAHILCEKEDIYVCACACAYTHT